MVSRLAGQLLQSTVLSTKCRGGAQSASPPPSKSGPTPVQVCLESQDQILTARHTLFSARGLLNSRVWLVQPLLFLQHFPEEWCNSRAEGGVERVKNNINKQNRNAGGQEEGPRLGVWGRKVGDLGQSEPLSFQPPEWRILQKKNDEEVSQRGTVQKWPRPACRAPARGFSLVSHTC